MILSSLKARLFHRNNPTLSTAEMLKIAFNHHNHGKLDQAKTIYHQILKLEPNHADTLHLLGVLTSQSGQYEQAVKLINQAIEFKPETPNYYNNLGTVHYNHGYFKESMTACEQAVRLNPNFVDAQFNLGNALFKLIQYEQAVSAYQKAITLKPDHVDAQFNLGNVFKELNQQKAAIAAFNKTIDLNPKHADAYYYLGLMLEHQELLDEALTAFKQAVNFKPDYAEAYYNIGHILFRQEQFEDAVSAYQYSLQLKPDDADSYNNLGVVLREQGKYDESKNCIKKALELKPDFAEAYNNLAEALLIEGQFDESKSALMKAIEIMPEFAQAYKNLSTVKKFGSEDNEIILRIKSLLNNNEISEDSAIYLNFAIAKIYDDCKDYDLAFEHYKRGNELKHKRCDVNREADKNIINTRTDIFNSDFFKSNVNLGNLSKLPVFIVGMPRSGTTLVEQIIASHPQAYGAGELNYIGKEINYYIEHQLNSNDSTELKSYFDTTKIQLITEEYLKHLREYSSDALRITDKMPANFLHLGLIAYMFPKARIIHCQRDALDTCLSIYFQNFSLPMDFAYSLSDIGHWYRNYERLMAHWNEVLAKSILNVQYEKLVEFQEQESRKIINFLGLDWDDACLYFQNEPRTVLTASSWQVRQPIYKSSVKRWKHYEKYLAPLKEALGHNDKRS